MQPVKTKRRSLVDDVVEQIRAWISQNNLSPGDRLPTESQMLQQLEVSRTALREAIVRLEAIGLVSVRRGQGMFVGDGDGLAGAAQLMQTALTFSDKDLLGVAELRCVIELHAVRRAAARATDEQLAQLAALFEKMGEASLEFKEAIQADFEFHRKLIELAGNHLMLDLTRMLHELMVAAIIETSPQPRDNQLAMERHRPILQAIQNHDPEAAEHSMRTHMDLFWTGIVLKTDCSGEQPASESNVE